MTRFVASLFIGHRKAIPHDGSRIRIAGGRVERQDAAERQAEDVALMAELAAALREVPGEDVAS